MQTLSYGYKKPQNSDTGDIVFPALADNIQQLNDHTHNGTNSAPLAVTSQAIASGAWVAASIGGGLYMQTVTLPGTLQYATVDMWFKLSTFELVYPSIEQVSANSYKIYTNNNALDYIAYYR